MQQVNFVSYRAVPVQVINNGSDLQKKFVQSDNNAINSTTITSDRGQCGDSKNCDRQNDACEISENCDSELKIVETANANVVILNGNSDGGKRCDIVQCVNTTVNITDGLDKSADHSSTMHLHNSSNITVNSVTSQIHVEPMRTFTSTEAQTDDLIHHQQHRASNTNANNNNKKNNTILIDTSVISTDTNTTDANINDSNNENNSSSNANMNSASETTSGKSGHGGRRSVASAPTSATPADAQQSREQRRRERRERRQPRDGRQSSHCHVANQSMHSHPSNCDILPDILHNHIPPPYTTLPMPMPMPAHCQINAAATVLTQTPPPSVLVPGPPSALIPAIGFDDDGRYTFPLPIMRR